MDPPRSLPAPLHPSIPLVLMTRSLESSFKYFLDLYLDPSKPILLALSGGADSLALLHLLLKYMYNYKFNLHVVHIDHRWREESACEAAELGRLLDRLGLPFHLEVLDPDRLQGNLESASREERLKFFKRVCDQVGAQAVFAGHHADDRAETTLTRVFEGHSLPYLHGIQAVSKVDGVVLWRPLLNFSKSEIRSWLEKQPHLIDPVEDRTNTDPRYMRGRLRTKIIPELSETYGKQITGPLCRLAEEAQELREYLDGLIAASSLNVERGPFGSCLDLSKEGKIHPFLLRYLVRRFCEEEGVCLSRVLVETVCGLLAGGEADRQVRIAHRQIYIDRKRLFVLTGDLPIFEETVTVSLGETVLYGLWKVTIQRGKSEVSSDSWKELWRGRARFAISGEECVLAPAILNAPYRGSTQIRKWWTDHKVPAFFRGCVPVLWSGGKIVHEFLTGRAPPHRLDEALRVELILEKG